MRLGPFRLERYGPFEQLDLPLDPTPGRINLVVAPNGYGKSVIRRAIGDFLFGIEARTPMTFRFGTEKMRLLADVMDGNCRHALVRRKGNGITLQDAAGADVDARRLLGGADEAVFRELFGLDTALLRSGGQDLIRSQGRLGQVLFAAGGGMARVRELLTELEHKRDELGRATRQQATKPLWGAFKAWQHSTAELRRVAMRPQEWTALERDAEETARNLRALLTEQADGVRERDRLRTISACRPWLDRLHAARLVLAEARDAPELDPGFEIRWRDALQQGVVSAGNAKAASLDLEAARSVRAGLGFDSAWIAAEAKIEALHILRGRAEGAVADLPGVEREQMAEQAREAALRTDLGWDVTVTLPAVSIVKDAQRRLRLHPRLAADAMTAQETLEAADRAVAATQAELEGLPNQGDLAAVADLVGLIRALGDPAVRLNTGRRKLREAEAALQAALAAIPDCPLREDALGTTTAPSEARLEAAGRALSQADTEHDQAVRAHTARLAEIEREQGRLAALERKASLPPPDALERARSLRDALWARFCSPERDAVDPAAAVALDRAMREADRIADALITHGQDVAAAAALRGRLAVLESDRTAQLEAVAQAAASVTQAREALLAMSRLAGGNADDIAGLRGFLRAREAAVLCRIGRDTAAAELRDLGADLRTLSDRLAAAMGRAPRDLSEIGALLAEADRRIEADRHLAARRTSLRDQLAKARSAQVTASATAEKASRSLRDWEAAWHGVRLALLRADTEAPAVTAEVVGQIEELRKTATTCAEKQVRIDDMRGAIALLAAKVAGLGALSPELAALPPIEAAVAFGQRAQAELREAARCKDADQRIAQAEARLTLCVAEADAAARLLDGLRAALRADDDAAAERQLQRSRAAAEARADSAEALRQLAVQGGGLSLEALEARAGDATAEVDAGRIAEIDARQQARDPLIEAARVAATAAAAALEQAGNGLDAAEAAQRREAAQAMLARTTEEALVLHATHALLQAALDRQASHADQPLLARIGEVFRTITGGAQGGVRVEDAKDGQTMVALEADGVTRKALDQLSEGTCDQLYLALRIAALEDYAATASPLPFIADDILQTFDDPRTEATLRALRALSEQVQVIVLTHHAHVGDLAAGLGGVQVMRLVA